MRGTKNIKEEADRLRVEPSDRVWTRLEQRLEQDKGKIKISTLKRWMAVAASLAILIMAGMLLNHSNERTLALTELEPVRATFVSSKYANELRYVYSERFGGINEGSTTSISSNQGYYFRPNLRLDTMQ